MGRRILLTGGRSPAALELTRLFHLAGHEVLVADTTRWCLAGASRASTGRRSIPSPRHSASEFVDALVAIIRQERIDLLFPTFEEIFYVAQAKERLAAHCEVLAADLGSLDRLHHKWRFVRWAESLGLDVPRTTLVTSEDELKREFDTRDDIVLKPVYSRFSMDAIVRPRKLPDFRRLGVSSAHPWVAQDYLPGRRLATYSVARNGRLTAHGCYPMDFAPGMSVAIHFRAIDDPGTFRWVERFVGAVGFTGQIAFDFIESANGTAHAIECNPRATSGVHLFRDDPRLACAFLEDRDTPLFPAPARPSMLGTGMLAYLLLGVRSGASLARWTRTFRDGRDVTFRWSDPLPTLYQFLGWLWIAENARRHRSSIAEGSIHDLIWNGDETASLPAPLRLLATAPHPQPVDRRLENVGP